MLQSVRQQTNGLYNYNNTVYGVEKRTRLNQLHSCRLASPVFWPRNHTRLIRLHDPWICAIRRSRSAIERSVVCVTVDRSMTFTISQRWSLSTTAERCMSVVSANPFAPPLTDARSSIYETSTAEAYQWWNGAAAWDRHCTLHTKASCTVIKDYLGLGY